MGLDNAFINYDAAATMQCAMRIDTRVRTEFVHHLKYHPVQWSGEHFLPAMLSVSNAVWNFVLGWGFDCVSQKTVGDSRNQFDIKIDEQMCGVLTYIWVKNRLRHTQIASCHNYTRTMQTRPPTSLPQSRIRASHSRLLRHCVTCFVNVSPFDTYVIKPCYNVWKRMPAQWRPLSVTRRVELLTGFVLN